MIKVVLFGNTGLANGVFRALTKSDSIRLCAVYTRKLPGNFPYYKEEELWQLSEQSQIPTFNGQDVNSELVMADLLEIKPDYIIVSSFNQIIKKELINLPKFGMINFHPSLLPKYRGPNPISWVIVNGEKETGLTIHKLEEAIDSGDILYQESLRIDTDDNLGSLYRKLSILGESMAEQLVEGLILNGLKKGEPQHERDKSYYPKSTQFRFIDINESTPNILNKIRAFTPFPKAILKINNNDYLVNDIIVNYGKVLRDSQFSEEGDVFYLCKEDCMLEFSISPIVLDSQN